MYGSSASEPTTPLRLVRPEKSPSSRRYSQIRSSYRDSIRLPPFQLPEITAKLSQDALTSRPRSRPRSRASPRPSMTPTKPASVLRRRRRRSSVIITDSGETVFHQDYAGPITIDYLRFVCKAIAQDQHDSPQNDDVSKSKQTSTNNGSQHTASNFNIQQQLLQSPIETHHRELDTRAESPIKTRNFSPTNSNERHSKSPEKVQQPVSENRRTPHEEHEEHEENDEDIYEEQHEPEKQNDEEITSPPPGTFDHSLQIPVDTGTHFLSPTEYRTNPQIERKEITKQVPRSLSYLERILQSRLSQQNEKPTAPTKHDQDQTKITETVMETKSFVIENKSDATTYDINWETSAFSNLSTSKLDNLHINDDIRLPGNDTQKQISAEHDIEADIPKNDLETNIPETESRTEKAGSDSQTDKSDNANKTDKPYHDDDKEKIETPEEDERSPHASDMSFDDFEPQMESVPLDQQETLSSETSPQQYINSPSTPEQTSEKMINGSTNSTDAVPAGNVDVLSPVDITSFRDYSVHTPPNENGITNSLFSNEQSETNQLALPETDLVTPISDTMNLNSPGGIIEEQYTMDNDQLEIFSDNSDSEEERQFHVSNNEMEETTSSSKEHVLLPRVKMSKPTWQSQTGNVSLSLPTVKNLVNYISISNLEAGPPRKKRKDVRITTDLYELIREKTDEFLGSLVADLGAYARHRTNEDDPQINIQDVILYLNKLKFTDNNNQRESQVHSIAKLAQNFLPLELLLSLDENLQNIRPPTKKSDDDYDDTI
mgnify:CR=1 FL=1